MKVRKVLIIIFLVFFINILLFGNVFADYMVTKPEGETNSGDIGTAKTTIENVWGTLRTILMLTALGVFVFAGVRFIFASPQVKADIKNQTIGLLVGSIIVFASSTFVKFIIQLLSDIVKQ